MISTLWRYSNYRESN